MAHLRVIEEDLDSMEFMRCFDHLGLTQAQKAGMVDTLKRITAPLMTMIAEGRDRQSQAQSIAPLVSSAIEQRGGREALATVSSASEKVFMPSTDAATQTEAITPSVTSIAAEKSCEDAATPHAEAPPAGKVVLVTIAGDSAERNLKMFFVTSVVASDGDAEEMLCAEVKERLVGRGRMSTEQVDEGQMSINMKPPLSLKKTMLRLAKSLRLMSGCEERDSFDYLVQFVRKSKTWT